MDYPASNLRPSPFFDARGTGYREPPTKRSRLTSVSALLKLVEKHGQGPSPGFGREHTLLAFLTIGEAGSIGRQALAKKSGLGEGSIRTVLKKLTAAGYIGADLSGCHLTGSGQRLYASIARSVSQPVPVRNSELAVGEHQTAVLVRSPSTPVGSGLEQRDSAIRTGATGATTYLMRHDKFAVPGGSPDCERDFPGKLWTFFRDELKPADGDVVILCGAQDENTAKLGALSAALTLL
jgi:hypothetical protein